MEFIHTTENIHNYKALEAAKSGSSTIRDFDMSSRENVEGQNADKQLLLDPLLKLDDNEIQSKIAGVSKFTQFPQYDSCKISTGKKLGKSATFPCSNMENTSLKLFTGGERSPTVLSEASSSTDGQPNINFDSASEKTEKATCQRSFSFPSTVKVVSALKGSREKEGQTPKEKLRVKWAHDVYDPPVTSASHTVKSHQQRAKSKKDKHRKRHKNGKSNRGDASEKKQASPTTAISEPSRSRIHPPTDDDERSVQVVPCVNMVEYAAHCQESTCGGCFLAGSLSKIQSPVAEAS